MANVPKRAKVNRCVITSANNLLTCDNTYVGRQQTQQNPFQILTISSRCSRHLVLR